MTKRRGGTSEQARCRQIVGGSVEMEEFLRGKTIRGNEIARRNKKLKQDQNNLAAERRKENSLEKMNDRKGSKGRDEWRTKQFDRRYGYRGGEVEEEKSKKSKELKKVRKKETKK